MFKLFCAALISLALPLGLSSKASAKTNYVRRLPPIVDARPVSYIKRSAKVKTNTNHLKLSKTPKVVTKDKIVLVLDPGHGGKDTGAIGRFKLKEKALNLQMAKLVKKQLEASCSGQLEVILTRNSDRFLTRQQRINIARQNQANLLVSLHADSSKYAAPQGVTIFTLSPSGFKDISKRWLKNQIKRYSFTKEASVKDAQVAEALTSIASERVAQESALAGKKILNALKKTAKTHKAKLIYADFWVLKTPHVPSVLIEMGFISNAAEARILNSSSYQEKLAEAISLGIKSYFKL